MTPRKLPPIFHIKCGGPAFNGGFYVIARLYGDLSGFRIGSYDADRKYHTHWPSIAEAMDATEQYIRQFDWLT